MDILRLSMYRCSIYILIFNKDFVSSLHLFHLVTVVSSKSLQDNDLL